MNPEKPSRDEIEAKLTALLLGELPAEEAQLLRWAISQDAALAKLHDRLKLTIGFVREVAANPAEATPAQTAPLKLSGERREKLLAHFKTVALKEFVPLVPPLKKRREISPLLTMAAAIALIAVLAAMLLPSLAAAKRKSQRIAGVSQANAYIDEQTKVAYRKIETDSDKAAPQTGLPARDVVTVGAAEGLVDVTTNAVSVFDNAPRQQIVLPQIQNSLAGLSVPGQELAVASPPPSDNFNFGLAGDNSIRDQNVYVAPLHNADPYQAASALQSMFQGSADSRISGTAGTVPQTTRQTQMNNSSSSSGGLGIASGNFGGGFGGGRAGGGGGFGGGSGGGGGEFMLSRSPAATPPAPAVTLSAAEAPKFQTALGELENETLSGKVAVNDSGVRADDATSHFYRSIAPDSVADKKDKVPMLGDLPFAGRLFQGSPANQDADIGAPKNMGEEFSKQLPGAVAANNGWNASLADDLSKSGTGTLGLIGSNAYNGVTAINGVALNAAVSAANPLGQFPGNTTVSGDSFALNMAKDENGALVQDGKLFYEAGRLDESEAKLQQALKTDPNNASVNYYLGLAEQSPRAREEQAHTTASQDSLVKVESAYNSVQVASMTPAARPAAPLVFQNLLPAHKLPDVGIDSRASVPTFAPPAQPVSQDTFQGRLIAKQVQSQPQATIDEDRPIQKTHSPSPVPTPEILTRENAFSTFSLNVSDVSFKLAAASLERGQLPDAASIRTEEFINAFDYRDPEPAAGVPVAFVAERARDPFAHNRDLLRFSIKTAAAGRQPGRPLNLVLLLDDSGSMERADRVAIIHEALKVLASQLQPQDTLSIVTFARTARLWVDGARGDQAGTAVNQVSNLTPEGGTNLEEAMNLAYATARRHYLANGVNRVVLLTDGAANLGNVNPEALKQKVESFRKQGIALDCFGIGWEGYNDDLLEVLSSNGDGRYGFINTPEAATTEFAAQLAGALHVAAEDVKVQVEFNPQRVISYRQIGYAKHQLTKEQFRDNTVAAAPLAAREAGNALYTVEVNPSGTGPVATVRVSFRIPGTTDVSEHEWQVPFDGTAPALEKSSPALRLASTASAFSEWLASSPFAQEVTTDQLLNYLNGVPAIYGADARPKQLETMIREAKSIAGQPSQSGNGGFGSGGTLF